MRGGRLVPVLAALAWLGCTPAPGPPPPAASGMRSVPLDVCVLDGDSLRTVRAEQRVAMGDTLVDGRPFPEVYADTGQYAASRPGYVGHETIDYDPRNVCFIKYGLPRKMAADRLVRLGRWRGVITFAERGDSGTLPSVIYVPVGPGCRFAVYQYEASAPPPSCPQPHRFERP